MSNKGEDLSNERIADYYTSLLHVSGADLVNHAYGITDLLSPNNVYDGVGNTTGLALSALHDRVIINNYIYPEGYDDPTEWLDAFFPIGVIVLTATNNDPSNRIAGTQWCKIDPPAQFLVGIGTSTDEKGDRYNFAQHDQQPLNGDLAGEYAHNLTLDELPEHVHVASTNAATLGPEGGEPNVTGNWQGGTNLSFFYYFGPDVNPEGNVVTNSPTGQSYQGQDLIQAFQNNTRFTVDGTIHPGENTHVEEHYRDWLVRWRFDYEDENGEHPYRFYTDASFRPVLGPNERGSLAGWGQTVPTPGGDIGPGWAGFLDKTIETGGWRDFADQKLTADRFITNSPRPVNIPWTLADGQQERILQSHSGHHRKYGLDKIHPGTFTARQLIIARNYLMNVLGVDDAAVALSQVQRLIDMEATVEQALPEWVDSTALTKVPGFNFDETKNTGGGGWHNNIPPNYGVYAWRRVEPGTICHTTRIDTGPPWKGTITKDQISTGTGDVFNLRKWAMGWNQNRDPELGAFEGWNGMDPAVITIAGADKSEMKDAAGNPRPVYIYSDDPSNSPRHGGPGKVPGMIIEDFPNNLTLINNGFIMGRGGDGGYKGDPTRVPHGSGQDGGDAIHITGRIGKIFIENANGGIGGGGGGGAGGSSMAGTNWVGDNDVTSSGGGGGAGGGQGGTSWAFDPTRTDRDPHGYASEGGAGGGPGERGKNGKYYVWTLSEGSISSGSTDICTDLAGPAKDLLPGIGGEAGGSGANGGNASMKCNGTGGGGGRILSSRAMGGGTGGMPGSEFSGLNADGTVKGFGDGPEANNRATSYAGAGRNPYIGWTNGYCHGRGCYGRSGFESPKPIPSWATYSSSGTPKNYGFRWIALDRTDSAAIARGYHSPVGGLPWVRASVVAWNPSPNWTPARGGKRIDKYLSPTGWNGGYHQSTFVAGGWANKPGLPEAVPEAGPGSRLIPKPDDRFPAGKLQLPGAAGDPEIAKYPGIIPMSWGSNTPQITLAGKGGGGWGAAGGIGAGPIETGLDRHPEDLSLATGGQGGLALRRTGSMEYFFTNKEGIPSRGLVYGKTE